MLAREGGALGKMLPIFQVFAGGPLGTGKQWFSWIHRCTQLAHASVPTTNNRQQSCHKSWGLFL